MTQSILVVDDDQDIRAALTDVLEAEGYRVHSACNGREGLSALKTIKPLNLVLLDQNMPLMNGDEFLQAKEKDEELAPVPVVVTSAVSNRMERFGAKGFLSKPLDIDHLLRHVQRHCM